MSDDWVVFTSLGEGGGSHVTFCLGIGLVGGGLSVGLVVVILFCEVEGMDVEWVSLRERDWKVWIGEGASLLCMRRLSGSLLPSVPVGYRGPAFGSRL